jgi:hypothetical protein
VAFTVAAATSQASQIIDGTSATSGGTLVATATSQSGLSVSGGSTKTFTMSAPPSQFSVAWSPTSGAYGTGSVLTATLDATAVNSTSLSIPLTSTITGISSTSVTIVIGAGSTSGTYSLSGSGATGGTGGTVTTAAVSQTAGGFALTFAGGQKSYTMNAVNEVLQISAGGTPATSVNININDNIAYTIDGGVPNDTVTWRASGNQPYLSGSRTWPEGYTGTPSAPLSGFPTGGPGANNGTFTLDGTGQFNSGLHAYWNTAGTYVVTVTFASTGHTRTATVVTYIPNMTINYYSIGLEATQNAVSQTFGYSSVFIVNQNGIIGLPFSVIVNALNNAVSGDGSALALSSPLPAYLADSGANATYALARNHRTDIVATIIAQYCASTAISVVVPAQVTYTNTSWFQEYGLPLAQYNAAMQYIYPVYASRNQYVGNTRTGYGFFRNPEAGGIYYWATNWLDANGSWSNGGTPRTIQEFYDAILYSGSQTIDPRTGQGFGIVQPSVFYAGSYGATDTGYNRFSDRGHF